MSETNATVALFRSCREVDQAVAGLAETGFEPRNLSVAARDCHTQGQPFGYYQHGGGVRYWGEPGAFWAGLWRTLSGWGFFSVPGIGPLLVAGPLAGWIAAGLENQPLFAGLTALGAGLYSIGIDRRTVGVCEAALRADFYLLVAHGAAGEVSAARAVLRLTGAEQPV